MSKLRKILLSIIGCFFVISGFASSEITTSKKLVQEESYFIESEDHGWVVLVKELNSEKFVLSFPKKPQLRKIDSNRFSFSAKEDGIEYRLLVDSELPSEDLGIWMQNYLTEAVQDSSKDLIDFSVSQDLVGPFTEMIYKKNGKVIREKRFICSGHIFTISSEGPSEGDDAFFHSFQIFGIL